MSKFIVFEGVDGTGKSTQAALLAERIGARLTREPGGSAVGSVLREMLLDPSRPPVSARTEALLMAADRAEHVATVIRPTLAEGRHVVSDRFFHSSLVYQGVGRGLGVDECFELSRFAVDGLMPDLVLLFLDPAGATDGRVLARGVPDRIESAGVDFTATVSAAYAALADTDRWGPVAVIDPSGSIDDVAERVSAAVRNHLGIG